MVSLPLHLFVSTFVLSSARCNLLFVANVSYVYREERRGVHACRHGWQGSGA